MKLWHTDRFKCVFRHICLKVTCHLAMSGQILGYLWVTAKCSKCWNDTCSLIDPSAIFQQNGWTVQSQATHCDLILAILDGEMGKIANILQRLPAPHPTQSYLRHQAAAVPCQVQSLSYTASLVWLAMVLGISVGQVPGMVRYLNFGAPFGTRVVCMHARVPFISCMCQLLHSHFEDKGPRMVVKSVMWFSYGEEVIWS